MRFPAPSLHDSPNTSGTARDAYLDRLSTLLGAERTRMIASAWSGGTSPCWLRDPPFHDTPAPPGSRRSSGRSMIRQTTTACVMAALGSCLFLYWGKSQAALADREIGRILRATQEAYARVGTLRAEWALLNQPDRLQDMAGRYLTLQPVAPTQFSELSKLGERLQAPVATPAAGSVEIETAPANADAAQPAPEIDARSVTTVVAALPATSMPEAALPATAIQKAARPVSPAESPPAGPPPGVHLHASARPAPAMHFLTPTIAEARQPVRVRDSGEALLNGDPETMPVHIRIVHQAASGSSAAMTREPSLRPAHRLLPPRIELPHWLMQAHLMRPGRSEPPHALSLPQGIAIPLAAPQPRAATVQRVIARPPPEPEHPPIPQAAYQPSDQTYEAPRYRPAFRQYYGYGNPYRAYRDQAYGGYGSPYGGSYGNPYYRGYAPPTGGYYQ